MKIYKISSVQLPPIPSGFSRAVHITRYRPEVFFNKGFDYSGQSMLQSTARVFQTNSDILRDGLFSSDERFSSGYAIIIDIPSSEVNTHCSIHAKDKIIPAKFIY